MKIHGARMRLLRIFMKEKGHYGRIDPIVGVKVADNYHIKNISNTGIHHMEV